MAMFTVYFDVAGHPDAPGAMFSSGFVSSMDKWLKFEKEWLALLGEYGIANPFHMSDFAAGVGQYASWKDDTARRAVFYEQVTDLIQRRTNKGFSQGLYLPDFKRMHREYEVPADHVFGMMTKPITYCGLGSAIQVMRWAGRSVARGHRGDTRLEYVHDRGDKHRGHFASAMRTAYGVEPIFKDKKEIVAIQLADILAWEHATYVRDGITGRKPYRPEAKELLRRLPGSDEWAFTRWKGFQELCEMRGFKKKDRGATE
ncbi:MAG: DUF3800 domain-containing protein [bacterium]